MPANFGDWVVFAAMYVSPVLWFVWERRPFKWESHPDYVRRRPYADQDGYYIPFSNRSWTIYKDREKAEKKHREFGRFMSAVMLFPIACMLLVMAWQAVFLPQ